MAANNVQRATRSGRERWVSQQLPWLATLAAFLYVLVKVAAIAGGDPGVARAVVANADPVRLILGLGSLALSAVLPIVLLGLGAYWIVPRPEGRARVVRRVVILIAALPLVMLASLVGLLAALIGVVGLKLLSTELAPNQLAGPRGPIRGFLNSYSTEKTPRTWMAALAGGATLVLAFFGGGWSLFDRDMWLPSELVCADSSGANKDKYPPQAQTICQAAISNRTKPRQLFPTFGYVLATDGGMLTILSEPGRRVLELPSSAIRARVLCPPLRELLLRSPLELLRGTGDSYANQPLQPRIVEYGGTKYRCHQAPPGL